MKTIYFISLSLVSLNTFSQQQGNVVAQNNINIPMQTFQSNVGNLSIDNNNNPIIQQINFNTNFGNIVQVAQISNSLNQADNKTNSNGNKFSLQRDFSSHSSSSSNSTTKKTHKHTFHKKVNKFNRNFYGKMASHKKSKHLVDVCFNWK